MGLFKSKTSFIPRKNRNGTTTAGQYSQYGISQSSNGGTSSHKEDLPDIYKRLDEKLDSNKVGTANGAASLDENGKVPTDQLPSYVDDVVEYETLQDFPSPGETGKIYISTSTNKTYRWSGSQYIDISSASDDCLLKSSKISDNEIGTIVAGGDVTSADNYLNNRGLKSLWAYITAAANDIVANLSTMIAAKQDAISVTTKSDTPTDNETVIMQANGSNDTKTYLRRKMSDVWTYIKGKIDSAYSSVLGSGITSSKVSSYDTHIADGTKHTTSAEKAIWNGKADAVHTHTKGQVGLGNVDNTSDADKPVSTAQQAVFDAMQSDIDDKAEYAGEPTITKGTFTLYPCGEMEADTSYTLPSGLLYSLKSFLSAVLKYASYGSIELKVGSNSMRGVLSLVRGNNTANIESHPNQTTTNVTCTLPKDGGTLLTEANLPTSLKNPYKLKINGQEYDGSSEKEISVDSNPTQNSTALVKSGGVYEALNGKADSSELSNYYLKTDTVDKAKKATNATYAEEADSATYDIAGDQINLTYLKKIGGVMSGDLKMSDASIRTTKLQDGDKMLEYSELTKSSTQPYTGRNLIGAHGGSGANVQTIIRSGGDLIHRRGNDVSKSDSTILDTHNMPDIVNKHLSNNYISYVEVITNKTQKKYQFSINVNGLDYSNDVTFIMSFEYQCLGLSKFSSQTLIVQVRNFSGINTINAVRKVAMGANIVLYTYTDKATRRIHVYADVLDDYTRCYFYLDRILYYDRTKAFGFEKIDGASVYNPTEVPVV